MAEPKPASDAVESVAENIVLTPEDEPKMTAEDMISRINKLEAYIRKVDHRMILRQRELEAAIRVDEREQLKVREGMKQHDLYKDGEEV